MTMQQATKTSRVLTLPLLPYEYTSTIEILDNSLVILTKKKNKDSIQKTNTISIPENTLDSISSILSKNLLPISSVMHSSFTSISTKYTIVNNFYKSIKKYLSNSLIDNPLINPNPYNGKITFNNTICNSKDLEKSSPKSTIFVSIPEDFTNAFANDVTAFSALTPLFDYLQKTYLTKDRIQYCFESHQDILDGTLLPPIIPIFNSMFYDYLQNFSFIFSFTSSSYNNKKQIITNLNVSNNKFSVISYNGKYDTITCITNPTILPNSNSKQTCYINYNSISDILDRLGDISVATSTDTSLTFDNATNFLNKDAITVSQIAKQDVYNSILPVYHYRRTIHTKKIKLLGDLEIISIEFPKSISTISNSTTFNRLLNTVVITDTDINSKIKCKSFSKLTASQKYNSILQRFNALYAYSYDSIKANLDKIGLTSAVLKRNNNIDQSYPLVESAKVNHQESSFINNKSKVRPLFEDLIKNIHSLSYPNKSFTDSLKSITKENLYDFQKFLYDPDGKKLFGDDILLNNAYAIFQKYITNVLPPLNFTCVHKDPDYQSLATKIITLKMYELYIYSHTAFNPVCFDQPELKLVNSPNFPKISPDTHRRIVTVRDPLETINEEFALHCYFFYIPRSIAFDIIHKVSLDMINSYNFLPITVNTVSSTTSADNTTATTPTTIEDGTTKELVNIDEAIIKGMNQFLTDTILDIEKYPKTSSLDNEGSNDISNKQ